jgi:hypothetical protein
MVARSLAAVVVALGGLAAPGGGGGQANGGGKIIVAGDVSKGKLGKGDWTTSSCCFDDDFWSYEISDADTMVFHINVGPDEAGSTPDATSPFKLEKKWKKKLTDQFVEAEVSFVGGAYPILLCRNPGGIDSVAGYGFLIRDDGTALIGKSDGASADILASSEPGAFDASGAGDDFLKLGGQCTTEDNGDVTLRLFVDEEEVLSTTDSADPIERGVVALSAGGVGTVVFDDVVVYKL